MFISLVAQSIKKWNVYNTRSSINQVMGCLYHS